MSVRDLIDAIDSGNAVKIEDTFNAIMAEKISSRLQDIKVAVSKNVFNEGACETKENEIDEDKDEIKTTRTKKLVVDNSGKTRTVYAKE